MIAIILIIAYFIILSLVSIWRALSSINETLKDIRDGKKYYR